MKRLFIIVAIIMAFSPLAGARQYFFKHIGIEDGLPNNTVFCTMQDHRGFIWVGTKDGLFRYDGSEFRPIGDENSDTRSGKAYSLYEGKDGKVWFTTSRNIGYYDPETDQVTTISKTGTDLQMSLTIDGNGNAWMLMNHQLVRYSPSSGEFSTYVDNIQATSFAVTTDSNGEVWSAGPDGTILHVRDKAGEIESIPIDAAGKRGTANALHIICTRNGNILFTTTDGRLMRIRPSSHSLELVARIPDGATINCITEQSTGTFWLGSANGIYICSNGTLEGPEGLKGPHELSNNYINSLMTDSEGSVWIGTYHGGLNQWSDNENSIRKLFDNDYEMSIKGKIIHPIQVDKNGDIWIGTEDGGLSRLHVVGGQVDDLGRMNNLPLYNYHGMLPDGDLMMVCTYGDGIFLFDQQTGRITGKNYLPGMRCYSFTRGNDGTIYCGTSTGVYTYDREKDDFTKLEEAGDIMAQSVYQDSYDGLWIGSYGSGIMYRKKGGTFEHITISYKEYGLQSNFISSIYEDRAHRLWITTEEAGAAYTQLGGVPMFTHVKRESGMPSDIACAVAHGRDGNIWISTTNGLVQYSMEDKKVVNVYRDRLGLVSDAFSANSCMRFPDGSIAFGTYNGFIMFNPQNIKDPISQAPVYITEISTGSSPDRKETKSAGHSAITTSSLKIKKKDARVLSIKYSALCYSNLSDVRYEYTFGTKRHPMTGITTDSEITFTNLRAGNYRFSVNVLGSNSPEATKSIDLRVVPPFFASTAALAIYLLLIGALIFAEMKFRERRRKNLAALERASLENQKQKEINDAKIGFFTNITHEFRTPLSLIKMPLDKIIENRQYSPESKDDIMTIKANTERLIELSNQFLDIKKAERRSININYRNEDFCALVAKVSGYFTPAVHERHISYNISIPDGERMVSCDRDLVEKILTNLLSNAVKYCKDRIDLELSFSEDGEMVQVRVESNGDPISGEDRIKIFLPFYQIKTVNSQLKGSSSTGLGLPYALELAAAMGGKLRLDDSRMDVNSFIFEMPVGSHAPETALEPAAAEIEADSAEFDNSRHSVLVVEDSVEMREYLCKELSREYNILSAGNGEEALEIIKNKKVDLVVSDIMMPVMDGCQLCNQIKKDIEYSHIPVILLTAAVGVETRIETLEVGADGYIEKPFSIELLRANIASLFKNREIAYNQFANAPLSHFNGTVTNNVNQEFMDELHTAVMDNIADQDLGIETLTNLMHTSKSTLYRKVKANTGLNINEYIRICRLKMAAELLSSQKYRINEVAYLTGFSSPSYFTTSFQKQFNVSPSNFVKNLNK